MKKNPQKKNHFQEEWADFQSPASPPPALRNAVLAQVHAELQPSVSRVVGKLGVVHFVTSLATLSICPQFGVRIFGEGMGLMHYFMRLGNMGCALACGTFFLASSLGVASLVFSRAEWRRLRSQSLLALAALVLPSIGFFELMGGEFSLEFSVVWTVGAILGGALALEGLWRMKVSPVTA